MWKIAVAILVGIPALYGLYVGFVVLRLRREGKRLARECAQRHLEMEWSLFTLFPMDLEDPITLHVVVERDGRRFEFSVFPSSMSSYTFTCVKVEGLLLSGQLRGGVYIQPRDLLSYGIASIYLREGKADLLTFGIAEMDAKYRLSEQNSKPNTPDALGLLRSTFAHPEVQKKLAAWGGSLEFAYGKLNVDPAVRDAPFFDGLEQVAQLVEAIESAMEGTSPYR